MGQSDTTTMRPFRANDWWTSKASLLMGFVYLFALWFQIRVMKFIPLAICSVVVIAGFASFGYLVNDFFDKEKDRLAGKRNFLLGKSTPYQIALATVSLLCIGLPWLYLPATYLSVILIAFQLCLFILYSEPPLRLKERGVIGVAVDALYAHAIPVMLAAYTFMLASTSTVSYLLLLLLFFWQFMSGVRNILIHQQEDRVSDMQSGTKTFVATISTARMIQIIRVVLTVEMLLCGGFFVLLTLISSRFGYCLGSMGVFFVVGAFRYMTSKGRQHLPSPLRYFPNSAYEKWLPLVYLSLLSFFDHYFIVFLVLHVVLFNFSFYIQAIRDLFVATFYHLQNGVLIPIRSILSKIVNYAIYYGLLLFHINLKQEQMSAAEYFKRKRRRDK